jgi:Ca2+-binding EF-hand superfamily protein
VHGGEGEKGDELRSRETLAARRSFSPIECFAQWQYYPEIFMKTIPVSLLLLAGLLAPAAALRAEPEKTPPAAPPPAPPAGEDGGGPGGGPPRGGDHDHDHDRERGGGGKGWQKADADGSGTLSRAEFNTMPRIQKLPQEKQDNIFKRLDKDGDNILSAEELKGMERGPNERHEAMMRLRELDTDQSGGVSFAEFKEGEVFKKLPPEKQEALFKRLDTDGDGQITPKDRPEPPPGGGPGGHPPGGGPGGPGGGPRDPRRMLRDLDENQDGAVSFDEFRKAPPIKDLTEDEQEDRFEALDKNHDKKLDAADFPPPAEKAEPAPPPAPPDEPKAN